MGFQVPIDWRALERAGLLETKIKNWISKKVAAIYDNKPMPDVCEYVMRELMRVRDGEIPADDPDEDVDVQVGPNGQSAGEVTFVRRLEALLDDEALKFSVK